MLANTAAYAQVRVHIGDLEPYLYGDSFSRLQCSDRGVTFREGHLVAGVANYAPTQLTAPVGGCNIVITRSQLIRRQTIPLKYQGLFFMVEKTK